MDLKPPVPTNQNGPQPSTSGQMSTRPDKYLGMEYITLYLKSTEYDFLRELSKVIKTRENAYGISCVTNLPEAILDKFPWLTSDIDVSGTKSKTNNIQMGTKVLGKGQKSSTTASQSNCSSISP